MGLPSSGPPDGGALWVLGNLTIDDVVLPDGTSAMGLCGGNAVYAALGAAIWGPHVALAARVGPDFPQDHVARLEGAGLRLELVRVGVPSIHNWALYEPGDIRRLIMWVESGSHVDQSIRPAELPAAVDEAAACHIAPMPLTIQSALVHHLRDDNRSSLLSLDPHDEYLAGHEEKLLALLRHVDLFLPSRAEARLLHGQDDPEAAARAFVKAGARVVAIKLGSEGSFVCDANGVDQHVPAVPVRVVDPTGAGDAYCGGFLAAYRRRPDVVVAACHGSVSASFAVERRGAIALIEVDPREARRRLESIQAIVSSVADAVDRPPLSSPPRSSTVASPGKGSRHAHG